MIQVETEADREFILANCKGMKIMFNQSSLAENQIQKIRACIEYNQLKNGSGGFTELKIDHSCRDNICSPIQLSNPLKVMDRMRQSDVRQDHASIVSRVGLRCVSYFLRDRW